MRIECSQEKIKEVILLSDKIRGKHMTLPVLSCFLFEASKNNVLNIKSTNLDLGIEISIPAKIDSPGVLAIPGSVLTSFILGLDEGDKNIRLESSEGNLKIKTQKSSGVIKTQPSDDYPNIPRVSPSTTFHLNGKDFVKGLKSVWYSSSLSNVKPELSSVFVYCDEEFVVFVATDAFRLAEKRVKTKKNKDFGQILIPHKNIPEIIRVLENIDDDVEINMDKNQISFSYKNIFLISRIIDGSFPDYKQIIPKSISTEAVLLKQDLINTLKISNVFSDKFNQVNIKINPTSKICEIKTKNNDVGENVASLEAEITGEPIDINFNYKYIFDSFQSIDSDSLSLNFSGLNKPLVIKPVSDTTFRYLVMPMNR